MESQAGSLLHRVLIADDDVRVRTFLREWFLRDGIEADVCPDGTSALEAFSRWGHSLMLLDPVMAGRGGLEILQDMRGAGIGAPVILMPGAESEACLSLKSHLDPFGLLFKPFSESDLGRVVERLESWLRNRPRRTT